MTSRPPRGTAARRRAARLALWFAGIVLLLAWVLTLATSRPGTRILVERSGGIAPPPARKPSLTVCTLNLGHARRDGWHRMLLGREEVEETLACVARAFEREGVDVAGMQEVDAPSWWSHGFDHLEWLKRRAGMPYAAHGLHVQGLGLAYGTAILSRVPILHAYSKSFRKTPPSFTKGFTVATLAWPGGGREVDVAAVHIDFSRPWTRREQFEQFCDSFRERTRPLIVLGDFNSSWDGWFCKVRWLAEALDLHAFEPERTDPPTLPILGWRVDWILISEELEFEDHRVLDDELSDHRAVVARIRMREPDRSRGPKEAEKEPP